MRKLPQQEPDRDKSEEGWEGGKEPNKIALTWVIYRFICVLV